MRNTDLIIQNGGLFMSAKQNKIQKVGARRVHVGSHTKHKLAIN